MTTSTDRLKVVLFSGGRGTGSISDALLKYPDIDLTVLVNAYDDGLSTGLLRRFIPGMLGPSDIRKVVSRIVKHQTDRSSQALQQILEYRFPDPMPTSTALRVLRKLTDPHAQSTEESSLFALRDELSLGQVRAMGDYLNAFLAYYEQTIAEKPWFSFSDTSLGNFLFAGCYLETGRDFNATIHAFCIFAQIRERVLNVTMGENRVLVGLKASGQYLKDEASIVEPQTDSSRLEEVFLLEEYLEASNQTLPDTLSQRTAFLRKLEAFPEINPKADQALREADVIIYGPGTQYSSLLPSYVTTGVGEAIAANTTAEKIFVSNIARDHDLAGMSALDLAHALIWHLNRKQEGIFLGRDLVTRFFFQRPEQVDAADYLPFEIESFGADFPLDRTVWIDWEGASGKHAGGRTVSELLLIVESQLRKKIRHRPHKVSIVVPVLNEAQTIGQVLTDLRHVDFLELGLEKEILVVDGGSTDETLAIIEREPDIRLIKSTGLGRGSALQTGVKKARGELVVFFPADAEYRARDIPRLVAPLATQEFPIVFGSRAFNANNLSDSLERVYGRRGIHFFLSKYGGMSLSMLILFLYQRYVGDPLTTVKGFNARVFRQLTFSRPGVDFDMELIAKLARAGYSILEIPINYRARTVSEGKKTTVWDGIACIATLLQLTWHRHKPSEILERMQSATPIEVPR